MDQSLVLFVDQGPIRQGFKRRTVRDRFYPIKGSFTDPCHAVRDRDACEVRAAGKREIPNARDAVRDRDACERFAAIKRFFPNARHAVRDHNRFDTFSFHSGDGFSIFTEDQFCFFLCFCFGFGIRFRIGFCLCFCIFLFFLAVGTQRQRQSAADCREHKKFPCFHCLPRFLSSLFNFCTF